MTSNTSRDGAARAKLVRPRRATLILFAAVAAGGGCGNYSNEDLEFMNAVPDQSDLSANLPARSALATGTEAELARDTHDTVKIFNGILDNVLGMVEAIRAYQPNGRGPNTRTWGPIPDTNPSQTGWEWQFAMTRNPDGTFGYEFDLEPTGTNGTAWLALVTGSFAPSPGVRRGSGSFTLDTSALRAAGFPYDTGLGKVDTLAVTYQTKDFPISVVMDLVTFPNYPVEITTTNSAHYEYGAQADGAGAMKFTMTGDLIPITPAIEVVSVTSQWLPSGAGRGDLTVEQGDDAGLMQSECWDSTFNATYNSKPWSPLENLNDPSFCPAIPVL
jgi:hypothetical protein